MRASPLSLGRLSTLWDAWAAGVIRSPLPIGILVVACFNILALGEMWKDTCTVDEAVHLLAGYRYITERDFSINPEHPPLQKILAAIPAVICGIPRSSSDPQSFVYESADPDALLASGRLMTMMWANILLLSVFAIANRIYGARAGLVAMGLTAFCPNLLAHSHFVTNDVPLAAMSLLSLFILWSHARRPTVPRSILAGVLLGGTLCTKYSGIVVVPIAFLIIGTRFLVQRQSLSKATGTRVQDTLLRSVRWIGWGGILLGTAGFTIWAIYGLRFAGSSAGDLQIYLKTDDVLAKCIQGALTHKVLPEAYLKGLGMVLDHSTFGHKAYALGRYSDTGWWWYFPFACLVKMPVAIMALSVMGLWAWVRRTQRGFSKDYFLMLFILLYGGFCVSSRLNIGVRHILPIFPMLYILAGGFLYANPAAKSRLSRLMISGLLLWTVLETGFSAPHFLSYFNLPSRLLFPRYSLLVDSNLDWGQDLGRLKAFLDQRKIPEIKLSYFGNGSPRHLHLHHVMIPFGNWYSYREREWTYTEQFQPGDYVAISATNYVGVLEDSHRRYYLDRLRGLTPIAEVGHSILVFRLPECWKD